MYVKATHDNYEAATCSYTLEVTPATLTVTAATREFVYCGTEQRIDTVANNYTVTGLVSADASATHTATVTGAITFPDEGSVASTVSGLTLTGASISDYNVNYVPGVLSVRYNPITVSLTTGGRSWTFDGTAHDTLRYSVTIGGVTTDNISSTFTMPNGQDVLTVYFDNASVTHVNEGEVPNTISLVQIRNGVHDVSGNYILSQTIGKLKIDPRPLTIKAKNGTWPYDGSAHNLPEYDITAGTLVSPNTLHVTVDGSITDVGTTDNEITEYYIVNGSNDNYNIVAQNGTLEITEGDVVTLTITANSNSWEYDGTAHSDNGYTLTIDGGSPISVTGSDHHFDNGDVLTVTIVGSVTNYSAPAANEITNVKVMRGTTDVTSHYGTSNRNNGTLTITKHPVTVNVTGHTLTSVYNGETQTASGYDLACSDALFNTATVSYSGTSSVSSINVCDIPMSLAAANFSTSDANFEASFHVTDGHLTITKRAATLTADDQNFHYDGSVHNAEATFTPTNVVAADAANISITVSGSIQYPNQSPVTKEITGVTFATPSSADNYDITRVSGKLTMDFGTPIDLTITSLGGTWTYDGTAHSKDSMSVSVNGGTAVKSSINSYVIPDSHGDVITITLGTSVMDVTAGTPNAIASYTIKNGTVDVRSKYHVLLNTGDLVVNPKAATITAKSHTWNYDGIGHWDHGYTVSGLVHPDTLTATIEGSVTTPDTVNNNVTAFDMSTGRASNYSFTLIPGKLIVKPLTGSDRIPLTITANSRDTIYNGSALTADGYDLYYDGHHYTVGSNGIFDFTAIGGDRLTVDIQGSITDYSDVAATNAIASWKVMHGATDVSSSYNVTEVPGTLTINKRNVTLTSATDSKTYDGVALTNHHVTVSGDGFIAGQDTASCTVTGTQTNVGSVSNAFTYTLKSNTNPNNYNITTVPGTLTVVAPDEVLVTITGHTDSKVYNGSDQPVSGYEWTSSNPLYTDAKFTFTGTATASRKDVGTTDMGLTSAMFTNNDPTNFPNVRFNVTDGSMTITPITDAIVVTATGGSKVYDGDALTATATSYTDNSSSILASGDVLVVTMEGEITHFGQTPSHVASVKVMRSGTDVTDNYTIGTPVDAVLEITKRALTLTSGSAEEVYNGNPITKDVVDVTTGTFATGEGFTKNVTGTRTDVGESPNTFTYTLNVGTQAADYDITTVEGTLKVNALTGVTVTITEHSAVVDYDGASHTVTGYDFAASTPLYHESDFTFTGTASVSGTNAGTYPMTLTDAMFTNNNSNFTGVTFSIVDGELEISKVTDLVTVTITGNNNTHIYDGNAYSASGYTWTSSNPLYDNTCFTTSNAAYVSRTNVDTTFMGLDGTFTNTSSNFENVTFNVAADGYIAITRNSTTLMVNCPTNTTHVYDGTEFFGDAATATAAIGTTTIEYSLNNSTWSTTQPGRINAGDTIVYVRATNPNYDTARCQYTLEVTKAPVVVTAASQQFTYNGQGQSNNGFTVTGMTAADRALFNATVEGSITYPSEGTVANRVTAHAFNTGFSSQNNYIITDVDGALTMVYGEQIPLAITTGSDNKVYDGTRLTNSTYTLSMNGGAVRTSDVNRQVGLSNGDTITVNFNGAGPVNVSEGTVSNTISNYTIMNHGTDVSGKYNVTSVTLGDLYITKKAITVTGDDHEFTYNGHPQNWPYWTVTGLVSPDTLLVTMTGEITYPSEGSVPNVPSEPYDFYRGSSDNYTVSFANGALTMVYPPVTNVTVKAVTDTMIYNGSALSNGAYTVTVGGETDTIPAGGSYTFANGDKLTATVSGSVTNVSESAADANKVTLVEIKNGTENVMAAYNVTTRDNALVIKKRPVTLTSATDSKTYDTHPLTNHTVTVGGMGFAAGQDTLSCTVTGTQTDIGHSTNTFTYELKPNTDANNYDITKVEGTLTVNAVGTVTVEITENSNTYEYDGTEKSVTGYTVTHISDPNYTTAMINYVGAVADTTVVGTKADTYNMGLLPTHFQNTNTNYTVNFVIVDGTLTITPKATPIVLTASSASKVYDGTALTSNEPTITSGALATGDQIVTTSTGTITHVGIVTNSIATCRVLNTADEDVTSCYTFGTHIPGQLEITKRPVTLTSAGDSKVYDGTALTSPTVTSSTGTNVGFAGSEGATYTVTGTITNVGKVLNMFTYSLNTNTSATDYNISVVYDTLKVTPRDGITVTITGNHDSRVYDGVAHTVTGYTVDAGTWNTYYSYSDVTCDTTATATQTVTGTKNMNLAKRHFHNTNPNFTNVDFNVVDGYMTITPITDPIVVTTASDSKMYDGSELTNAGFTYTGTLASGDVLEVVTGGTVTHVSEGTVDNTITSCKVMRGSVDVTANYTFGTPVLGTLHITKRDVVLTSASATRNFNGSPLSEETVTVSGSGFVAGTPTYSNFASQLHYGSTDNTFAYTLPAGDVATDYAIDTVKGTLTVNKAELTLTSVTTNFLYNGTVQSDNRYSLTLNGDSESNVNAGAHNLGTGDVLTVTFPTTSSILRPAQNPVENDFSYEFTSGEATDYAVTKVKGELTMTISTVQMPLTITTADQTWTFDGESHTYRAYTVQQNWLSTPTTLTVDSAAHGVVTLATGDRLYVNIGGYVENYMNSPRDNFIQNITITRDGEDVSDAYEITQVYGKLRINQRHLIITGDTNHYAYDGRVHTADTCRFYGLVAGTTVDAHATGSIQFPSQSPASNPVTYRFTSGSQENYIVEAIPGQLTMTYDTVDIELVANTTSWNYDGNAHSDARYTLTIGTDTPIENVEAGECPLLYGDVMTVTVTGSVTDYDASYSNNNVIAITSIKHGSEDVSGNYRVVTRTNGTLTINRIPAEVTITGNSSTVVYNGYEQRVDGYTVAIDEPLYTTADFTFAGVTDTARRTDIGTTDMTMTATDFTNINTNFNPVNFVVNNGSITVTPITDPMVITAASDSKVYDATALTNDGYTFTDGVLVGTDVLTAVVEGTQTAVGSSANTVTSYEVKRGGVVVTSNYTGISTVAGTLEVTKRPITITANDYTVMYDGAQHTYAENDPILTIEAESTDRGLLSAQHLADTTMTGAGTAAGTYPIVITDAVIKDGSDADVTANYQLSFVDGTLTITQRTGVVVTIQEHGKEVDYNATDQQVTGYTVASIVDPVGLYTVNDFSFIGQTSDTIAHGTGAEDALHVYDMNLRSEHFRNDNANYDDVTFVIRDSSLYIYPKLKATVTTTPVSCNINNGGTHDDGTATITVTGGRLKNSNKYGFTFDGSSVDDNSPKVYTLAKGNYTVRVTDSLGYYVDVPFEITEPEEMTAVVSVPATDARCPNQGSYEVSVAADGGNGGYTYAWSGDATNANNTNTIVAQSAANDCDVTYEVDVTVTDNKSCTVSAMNEFKVEDHVNPTFTVPAALTLYKNATCDASADTNVTHSVPTDLADNCTPASAIRLHYTDAAGTASCANEEVIIRTWWVTDSCNNSSATATQTITLTDTTRPTFTVPAELTLYKDEHNNYNADTTVTHSVPTDRADNCGVTGLTVAYSDVVEDNVGCAGHTVITRTWSITDACGNTSNTAVQTINIIDTVRPTYVRPLNATLYKDANCVADTSTSNLGVPTVLADNSTDPTNLTVSYRNAEFTSTCEGSYSFKRIWRVIDDCGNVSISDSIQVITVEDTTRPTFTAPADTTICRVNGEISANLATTGEVAQADITDNCTSAGDFTITWYDLDTTGTDAELRVITRRWVVKDLCDNADTVNQTITVKPSILTSGNVTYVDPTPIEVTMKYGVCDTLIEVALDWTNNMTGNTVVVDSTGVPYGHRYTADHGPYTITWTLTDGCGDRIEVSQTITVNFPPCGGSMMAGPDGDGNTYRTVQVGCNCWMAENMRTTKYMDGTAVTPAPMTYGTPVTTYGYLYTYYAATKTTPPTRSTRAAVADGQGICPEGWHVPDDEDFADLMSHYEAEDLMSTEHWLNPGTNASGYGLEPAGVYNAELGRYEYLYVQTYLWSYEPGATVYHSCQFGSACGTIEIIPASANNGFSVRCVRNTED